MSDGENNMENEIKASCFADLKIEIQAEHSGGKKPATFKMVAYAGNPIMQEFSDIPVIINTETTIIAFQNLPILKDHEIEVAHSEKIFVKDGQILAEGIFSIKNKESEDLVASSKIGFPWQASVRGPFPKADIGFIEAGQTKIVNGKIHEGPAIIANNLRLKEISILALGADSQTSVNIAAKSAQTKHVSKEETIMTEAEIKANKLKEDNLKKEEEVKAEKLKKEEEIKAEKLKEEANKEEEIKAQALRDKGKSELELKIQEEIKASNAAYAKNITYRQDLEKVCGKNDEILAKALENTWSIDKAELETIKAGRINEFNITTGSNGAESNMKSIEIVACMSMGVKDENLAKVYTAQEMEHASKSKGMGIKGIFEAVCRASGVPVPHSFGNETIKAAFTTLALPGIFSNALNKVLLQQYNAFPAASVEVSMQSDVQDFKVNDRFRLVGSGDLLKVAGDGELKSGNLDEDKFTNQIDTFGRILWLTRQDIINDDMGAFAQIPRMMGRKGAQLRETLFWDIVKDGQTSGFFAAGNNNLETGAGSILSVESLSAAEATLAEQKDKNDNPVSILPRKLVVPPALRSTAESLMTATSVNDGSTNPTPNNNPHTGKYDIVVTPFLALSSGGITGSDLAWYLAADGEDVAAWDTAYLRGQRVPTVETGETSFEKLGIAWRVFFDIGVAEQDFRAAVKSVGA